MQNNVQLAFGAMLFGGICLTLHEKIKSLTKFCVLSNETKFRNRENNGWEIWMIKIKGVPLHGFPAERHHTSAGLTMTIAMSFGSLVHVNYERDLWLSYAK